jgi:hypothetical protein
MREEAGYAGFIDHEQAFISQIRIDICSVQDVQDGISGSEGCDARICGGRSDCLVNVGELRLLLAIVVGKLSMPETSRLRFQNLRPRRRLRLRDSRRTMLSALGSAAEVEDSSGMSPLVGREASEVGWAVDPESMGVEGMLEEIVGEEDDRW